MTDASLPKKDPFKAHLSRRQLIGRIWDRVFYLCNFVAILTLIALGFNISNNAFGYVAMSYKKDPVALAATPIESLDETGLAQILQRESPKRLRVVIRDTLSHVANEDFSKVTLQEALKGAVLAPDITGLKVSEISDEQAVQILVDNLDQGQLYAIVVEQVVEPTILESWPLFESITQQGEISKTIAEKYPTAKMEFRSWVNPMFVRSPISSEATTAGLRTALLGTLLVITITSLFAFPLGIGTAIYLEEYATDGNTFENMGTDGKASLSLFGRLLGFLGLSRLGLLFRALPNLTNRLIEINIRNLAGVPSIIYGMLGLTVFVRLLAPLTSGAIFGVQGTDGRTILSAGLTLGLVILPVIIINAQEAIRAVAPSIREASYGLGATKWQTIARTVLPASMPGILTGVILSLSRAIGETAPLIVVGASTFINVDPSGPFSKFTVVPIQIFQWTSKPQQEFRNTAAAAIVVLMIVLLLLNSVAIALRNRYTRKLAS